jgi:RES domain-containing protein
LIVAWRLVKARYATEAFSGEGARREGGRWNPKGTPVVYLADHPALAALEMFVHLGKSAWKIKFTLFRVEIPKEVKVLELFEAGLPANWRAELRLAQEHDTWDSPGGRDLDPIGHRIPFSRH